MNSNRPALVALTFALVVFAIIGAFWAIVLLIVLFHEGSTTIEYVGANSSMGQNMLNGLGFLVSVFIGLATALAVERAKKPRIEIALTGPNEHEFEGRKVRSVHLRVVHQGVAFFDSFLLPSPALACVAKFRITKEDGSDTFSAPFEARWTGSQQPPEFKVADGWIYPSVFEMLKKRDVFPHTTEDIDVCIKYEGDTECYVFNNSSYVKGYRHQDLRLPSGVYVVDASVSCGNLTVARRVKLRNDGSREEFRIEAI